MILAMYTIRSKQEYIYRTNKIVEIMGASEIISNAWNVLFEQAEKSGIRTKRAGDEKFSLEETKAAFDKKSYQMQELFCGGGNETVLFDSVDTYHKVNHFFSYYLLKEYPGLIPMSVMYEVSGNYRKDYKNLMEEAEVEKSRMRPGKDSFILPFSLMDRVTQEPMSEVEFSNKELKRYSKESKSKRDKGIECRNKDEAIKILDKMVTKRGKESLLAVVHADGNNMGSKIMDLLGEETSYDYCINAMRRFTKTTAEVFGKHGLAAIENCRKNLEEQYKQNKNFQHKDGSLKKTPFVFRKVIADGDDMTFICNARFVMEYVKAYVTAVQNYQEETGSEWNYSSCAGICIFHSHYSFAEAYKLAEMACDDGAKDKVHIVDEKGCMQGVEEGWVDFHYLHSGVGGELATIREMQGTNECMARPWLIAGKEKNKNQKYVYKKLEKLISILKKYNVSRTDIKNLGIDWESNREEGLISLRRVFGHHSGLEQKLEESLKWSNEELMKAIYDAAEVYDLWYAEE